jgi:hypothetical protein
LGISFSLKKDLFFNAELNIYILKKINLWYKDTKNRLFITRCFFCDIGFGRHKKKKTKQQHHHIAALSVRS